eukprot:5420795-Lingulodinium_polyedra.AAC.1
MQASRAQLILEFEHRGWMRVRNATQGMVKKARSLPYKAADLNPSNVGTRGLNRQCQSGTCWHC